MDTSDPRVKDRSAKVERRKNRMPVNGIAMKRLLIERAAKAQASKKAPEWRHWHIPGQAGGVRKRDAVAANGGKPVLPCDIDHSIIAVIRLTRADKVKP